MLYKTTKQIADELGVSKQQVYRYIKRHNIKEALQENGTMYYDEAAKELIIKGFSEKTESNEAEQKHTNETAIEAVIAMLQRELEVKNGQIEALQHQNELLTSALKHTTSSLEAAHALHAGTIQQNLLESTAEDLADRGEYVETVAEDPKGETSPITPSEAELLLEQLATSRGFKKRRLLKQIRKRGSHGAHI